METQEVEQGPDPRRWLMLVVVLSVALMVVLDTFIVNVALPSLQRSLHASTASLQLVVAGYTLAFAVLLVTSGRMGDLYGRKRMFMVGMAGFTLFSGCCGLAPTAVLLVISRIVQGAAAALMFPQVVSFIQVTFEADERTRAFSYYVAISGLASILGQVFGGFLLAANVFGTGWRGIFLVNVPVGVMALLAAWSLLRESRVAEVRRLDYGGVGLLTLTLFLLIFPLVQAESTGWSPLLLICLVLFVPCFIVFLAYEQRTTRQGQVPLVQLSLFRERRFPAGLLTIMVASGLFAALLFLLAFYLQTILHLTPLQAGLVIMSASISFFLASFLGSVATTRLGRHSLSAVAALVTGGYLLIFLSAQWLVSLWGMPPLLAALFLLGLGMGLLSTLLLPRTLEGSAPDDAGAASGVYTTGTQIAGALGVALIGLVDTRAASSGNLLDAFITSILLIVLLSVGLSLTVLPLAGPHPAATGKGAAVPARERAQESRDAEGTEMSQSLQKGKCLSCPAA